MSDARDARRFAPAAARNREPIADALRGALPERGCVLEIASGSGEHAVHFARAFPELVFQPSDVDADGRTSIDAWRAHSGLSNLLPALAIDVTDPHWPAALEGAAVAALLCSNMIHIAPWEACEGFWRGAGVLLRSGAPAILYGPFKQHGEHSAPSNAAFDESLRSRDPRWGVRDIDRVETEAGANGFRLERAVAMPANNQTLVFRRR